MKSVENLKQEALNRLITKAAQFLWDQNAELPGMKEVIEGVLAANTSSRKVVLLNDLVEWIDGISPQYAKEIRDQASSGNLGFQRTPRKKQT